jgi:hypothetical protein
MPKSKIKVPKSIVVVYVPPIEKEYVFVEKQ